MTPEIQLTDEELRAVAHKLCQIRGISPYLMVGAAPATELAVLEVKRFIEIVQAIDHVKEIP